MTSLGISPTIPSSLLIPPNPSFSSADNTPRGGILRNARRESDASCPSSPAFGPALSIKISEPTFKSEPNSPEIPVSHTDQVPRINSTINNIASSPQPRIRFAPLPDPRRPRSLSTGDWVGGDEEPASTLNADVPRLETEEEVAAVIYDEEAVDEEDEGSEDESGDKKSRRWSKSMGMGMSMSGVPGWRGTKKLLGLKEEKKEEVYSAGAPLKKSVSTGTSPFKMSSETERRRLMQGSTTSFSLSPRLDAASPGHRRNSSLEPTASSSLGTSPGPVKMLNGRVYGSRRASEAAERQATIQAKMEPAFVEWGNSTTGGMGSLAPKSKSLLSEDDDGSGMEWVKRRREERRRQQQAQAAAKANGTSDTESRDGLTSGASSVSHSPISTEGTHLVTPHNPVTPLPPTPVIHISEPGAPPVQPAPRASTPDRIEGVQREHITQAIQMPKRNNEGRDVFDDGDVSDDEEEDDEEEEDDGDFDDDEEEEDATRTTCTAAGVEVISRHKD